MQGSIITQVRLRNDLFVVSFCISNVNCLIRAGSCCVDYHLAVDFAVLNIPHSQRLLPEARGIKCKDARGECHSALCTHAFGLLYFNHKNLIVRSQDSFFASALQPFESHRTKTHDNARERFPLLLGSLQSLVGVLRNLNRLILVRRLPLLTQN